MFKPLTERRLLIFLILMHLTAVLPAQVDTQPPISLILTLPEKSFQPVVAINYQAVDQGSGVAFVRLFFRKDFGPFFQYNGNFTASPIQFDSALTGGDGFYEFYTLATDHAGNQEPAKTQPQAHVNIVTRFNGGFAFVDPNAPGSQDGSSWTNATHTIGAAVEQARGLSGVQFWVADGTYWESIIITDANISLYGGFEGFGGAAESELGQRDFRRNQTIIDAGSVTPRTRVVRIFNDSCRIDGFTITGGQTYDIYSGGGIYSVGENCTIENCNITGNFGERLGGGIFLQGNGNTIRYSIIQNNIALDGGGIYGSILVENCVFINNRASQGGAIAWNSGLIKNSYFAENRAGDLGGAVHGFGQATHYLNCIFRNNDSGRYGGAIFEYYPCGSVRNCLFYQNTAASRGGAITISGNYNLTVVSSIFVENNSHALFEEWVQSDLILKNNLFFNNLNGDILDEGQHTIIGAFIINDRVYGAENNIDGDPLFVNPGLGDFQLRLPSPAIDTGYPQTDNPADFFGTARPFDIPAYGLDFPTNAFDIGPFEYTDYRVFLTGYLLGQYLGTINEPLFSILDGNHNTDLDIGDVIIMVNQ